MNKKGRNILSVRIKERLKSDILSGRFSGSRMLATEQTLCAEFGASRETIRRSIELLIQEKLCERIPNRGVIVTSDASGRAEKKVEISILTPYEYQHENYYYKSMLAGFVAGSRKYGVSFRFIARNTGKSILSHRASSPMIVWPAEKNDYAECCRMLDGGVNFLVLSASFDDMDIPAIDGDNRTGAEMIASLFAENGHRSAGIVLKGRLPSLDHSVRLAAFRGLMRKKGSGMEALVFMPEKSIYCNQGDRKRFVRWLEENSITAVFAIDLELAEELYVICGERSISIPGDISMAAFDDSELAEFLRPPLTVVSQPFREMAESAVRRLAESGRAGEPCRGTELFPVSLIRRESVRNISECQKMA